MHIVVENGLARLQPITKYSSQWRLVTFSRIFDHLLLLQILFHFVINFILIDKAKH
jgi:hypothetical protein